MPEKNRFTSVYKRVKKKPRERRVRGEKKIVASSPTNGLFFLNYTSQASECMRGE